jgi:hypothetical protein
MQQVDSADYNVIPGENVTLTIVAHTVNEDIAVSWDGTPVVASSHRPAVFHFSITKASGAQFLVIECHFTATDASGAYYQFSVQGSNGGGSFNAGSIRKADNDWESVLQFTLP